MKIFANIGATLAPPVTVLISFSSNSKILRVKTSVINVIINVLGTDVSFLVLSASLKQYTFL
jgi:hypothetical protein